MTPATVGLRLDNPNKASMSHRMKNAPPIRIRKSHNIIINGPIRINNRTITSSEAEYKQLLNINKKKSRNLSTSAHW